MILLTPMKREDLVQQFNTIENFTNPKTLDAEIFTDFLLYLAEHFVFQDKHLLIHQLLRVEINVQGIWRRTRRDYRLSLIDDFTNKTGLYKEIHPDTLLDILDRCFVKVFTMAEEGKYSSQLGRFLEKNKES